MADTAQKRAGFIRRYVAAVENFLDSVNTLSNLKIEWDANAYADGANPTANNIIDTDLTATAPWITVLQINQGIGAVEAIRTTIATNRGYLESLRP